MSQRQSPPYTPARWGQGLYLVSKERNLRRIALGVVVLLFGLSPLAIPPLAISEANAATLALEQVLAERTLGKAEAPITIIDFGCVSCRD